MAATKQHKPDDHQEAIKAILARFPVTGRDRTWQMEPVVNRAFGAAHRVFDKHFKGKLKVLNK
jgi:hypothetical protein